MFYFRGEVKTLKQQPRQQLHGPHTTAAPAQGPWELQLSSYHTGAQAATAGHVELKGRWNLLATSA